MVAREARAGERPIQEAGSAGCGYNSAVRVVVIGGGIIGLLCAHHLRRLGAEVVVLERQRVGAACSAGNAGWVTPSISTPVPAPGLRTKMLRWMLRPDSPLYIRPTAALGMLGSALALFGRQT